MTRFESDPHPECDHVWCGIGMTTIGDPPISHAVCFDCDTFRDTMHDWETGTGKPLPPTSTYADEWIVGPFDRDKKLAQFADRIAQYKKTRSPR